MSQVKGGSRLTRAAPAALLPIEEMGLKLCMPDLDDIPELAEAMWGAFDRVQVRVGDWVPFSEVVNSVKGGWERKDLSQDLAFRLGGSLQFASLLRPVRAESIALLVRQSRDSVIEGPIAAYFELSLLPPDGRRPEAEGDGTLPSTMRPEPYLTNLFVTPRSRRQGLGRAMVQVAEEIVVRVWGRDKIYLHIDGYEPSRRLYVSAGFQDVSPPKDGVTHMWKQLEIPVEDAGDGASGEVELAAPWSSAAAGREVAPREAAEGAPRALPAAAAARSLPPPQEPPAD